METFKRSLRALRARLSRKLSARKPVTKTRSAVPNGAILYRGPSMITGRPIVAIVTGLRRASSNSKTGNLLQTFILSDEESPVQALKSGRDEDVCGNCKHRPRLVRDYVNAAAVIRRSCYVVVAQGPTAVWKALQRGIYPIATDLVALGRGRLVRLGTYGDPAAVPAHIWEALISEARGHAGYTHAWENLAVEPGQRARVSALCMASADSCQEADRARELGLRTFRVRTADEPLRAREIICPASAERNHVRTCDTCTACNGGRDPRASVAIIAHGTGARFFPLRTVAQ